MKKKLYYRHLYRRDNVAKQFFDEAALIFASPFRLLIEVFIRKNFGERYFRLSSVLTTSVLMFLLPVFIVVAGGGFGLVEDSYTGFIGWFLFLIVFTAVGVLRESEIDRSQSIFDFNRFSLSRGEIYRLFIKLGTEKGKVNLRKIEVLIEPAPFFLIGFIFLIIGQYLGYLLIFSSLMYSYSYAAAYRVGDDFVLDKIDEMITNKHLENDFLEGLEEDGKDGFRYRGLKPVDRNLRQQILQSMVSDDDAVDAK